MELSVNQAEAGDQEVLNMLCADPKFSRVCIGPVTNDPERVSVLVSQRVGAGFIRWSMNETEVDLVIEALQELRKRKSVPVKR